MTNREIKFRAYHKTKKQIYNVFSFCSEYVKVITDFDLVEKFNISDFENIQQFTGLKDKNGVEIFEGDILKHELATEPEHMGFIVSFFDYKTTVVNVFTKEESDFNVYFSNYNIIGNIHENPELLK